MKLCFLLLVSMGMASGNVVSVFASPPVLEGCPVFPADNIWNTPVDAMPVSFRSSDYISRMGADTPLHPDFGRPYMESGRLVPIGIPYIVVSDSQPKVPVQFDYDTESDPGPYPIPPDAPIEGVPDWNPGYDGDRHILVLDRDNCLLYETFYSWPNPDGSWSAGSGAIFNLNSHALRPNGWTSADAAGLPILPGLVRYDEVAAGTINHALRFTAANTRNAYVWPARHQASPLTDPRYPPLGQRFRLKAGFDISGFSQPVRVILLAMKKYGIILADNGSNWYISGTADDRWDNNMLVGEFSQLKGSDFEAVDVSSLMLDPNSGQAKQAGGGQSKPVLSWSILLLKNSP